MALITDANAVEIPELLPYENGLLETADKERVEIATKIQLATEEVRARIGTELGRTAMDALSATGYSPHNVVVTDALRRWLHCHALHLFYLECYGLQLNERYKEKQQHYARRASAAGDAYLEPGIGVVMQPLARPTGIAVEELPGSLEEGHYYVAGAWQGATGKQSALSAFTTFSSGGEQTMRVSLHGAPAHAIGWNVYVGATAENAVRQNTLPIAIGQSWVMSEPWDSTGAAWGNAQTPDVYLQPRRIFPRG